MLVASAYLIAVLPLTCLALVALLRDWNYLLEGLILFAIISAVLAAIAAKKLDAQERRSIT
jgi:membrane protein implicated in regulation of membrane protease activity